MYQNYQKNADFGLFRSFSSSDFSTIGFIKSAYPLKAKKIIKVFWSPPSNQLKTSFWCLKTRISWTSRRDTFMKIKYLESEDFFTSNGFFKIWNHSSGKNFPIFGQKFVPTLGIQYIYGVVFRDCSLFWPHQAFFLDIFPERPKLWDIIAN